MTAAAGQFQRRYGPWAVVTGASDGIGRAFAEQLAGLGMNLVLVARRAGVLEELAGRLQRQHGVNCHVLELDLAEATAMDALAAATRSLDVGLLVAAAGFGSSGPFLCGVPEVESGMIDLNCKAVMAQAWHFGHRFARRGRGGLVLLGSLLGFFGVPQAAQYAATKAWVQSFAEGLHHEWKALGVDVIAAAPGPVHTGFAARAGLRLGPALTPDVVARQTLKRLGRAMTVRPGTLSWLLGWSLASLPRGSRIRILGRVMAGMTAHRRDAAGVDKTNCQQAP